MIHYHGGPITPETCARRAWHGRHAFISWAEVGLGISSEARQITLAASICQSFALDNGAFTIWRAQQKAAAEGRPVPVLNWPDYYDWCAHWLRHPACDWAVIPDVIEGSEAENDELLDEWPHGHRGVPVWHLNESRERLVRLADRFPRIALGSAAGFDVSVPQHALDRLADVLPAICDDEGFPRVKLHGLRMLNEAIITEVPLASGDSTNVARNVGIDKAWIRGSYPPATKETRADIMVERIERALTPHRLQPPSEPTEMFAGVGA